MKTEQQLVRTELELLAIDIAYDMIRYLGYRPKQDSWKSYCRALKNKLGDELEYVEFRIKNPTY